MAKFKDRRRKIYCGREIRFLTNELKRKFIAKLCLIIMVGAILSGLIVYLMSKGTVTTIFRGSRLRIMSTADFILPAVLLSGLIVIAFIGIMFMMNMFFAYYRAKKSLCQIKEEVEKADTGNLNVNLNFRRRDDEFKILASSLNKMIHNFRNIVFTMKKDVEELESNLGDFIKNNNQQMPEKIRKNLEELKRELSRFS